MTSPNDPSAPLPQPPDLDAAYVFEAGLTDLESAFVQLLRGSRDHPGLTPAEFAVLAAPILADIRRVPAPRP